MGELEAPKVLMASMVCPVRLIACNEIEGQGKLLNMLIAIFGLRLKERTLKRSVFYILSMMQDSELDIIDGVGAETGHVMRTTVGGRSGQAKTKVIILPKSNLNNYDRNGKSG
ncbi:hypothetical protein ACH5RR_022639 [Cinchona calisaya]|uniref:Uncharacterized protein n=1 Tax=Cinchona calisaya TaxID=153742 RepID=A0ABD2ZBI5_9GENT